MAHSRSASRGILHEPSPDKYSPYGVSQNAQTFPRKLSMYEESYVRSAAAMFTKVDRVMSGMLVTVNIADSSAGATCAYSDIDTIWLVPSMVRTDDVTSLESTVVLTGLNYHELAHVLFTPHSNTLGLPQGEYTTLTNRYTIPFVKNVWNLMEDARIERLFMARYPSTLKYFTLMVMREVLGAEDSVTKFFKHKKDQVLNAPKSKTYSRDAQRDFTNEADAAMEKMLYVLAAGRRYLDPKLVQMLKNNASNHFTQAQLHDIELLFKGYHSVVFESVTRNYAPYSQGNMKAATLIGRMCKILWDQMSETERDAFQQMTEFHTSAGKGTVITQSEAQEKADNKDKEKDSSKGDGNGDKSDDQSGDDADGGQETDREGEEGSKGSGNASGQGDQEGDEDSQGAGSVSDADSQDQGDEVTETLVVGGNSAGTQRSRNDYRGIRSVMQRGIDSILNDPMLRNEAVRTREKIVSGSYNPNLIEKYHPKNRVGIVPDEWRAVQKKMQRDFETLRAQADPGWYNEQPSGRVNMPGYVDAHLRGERLDYNIAFDRWDEGKQDASDIEAVLLIDCSGSMLSQLDDVARGCWAFNRSLAMIGASTTVFIFGSDCELVVPTTPKPTATHYDRFHELGGTVPRDAMRQCYALLKASKRSHKLFITLTDGSWSYKEESDKLIEAMNAEGFHTGLVFMDPNLARHAQYYRKSVPEYLAQNKEDWWHPCTIAQAVTTPQEFVTMARSMVRNIMRRR